MASRGVASPTSGFLISATGWGRGVGLGAGGPLSLELHAVPCSRVLPRGQSGACLG